MRSQLMRAALTAAAIFCVVALPVESAQAQKALVYCPVGIDDAGCAAVVSALGARYLGGVDKGYDGSGGTINLATADLGGYTVLVIPSLADDSTAAPYALLRDPAIAHRLHDVLLGRIALWSGTPDIGSASRSDKDALLQNLATWAGGNFANVNGPGLVALMDQSQSTAARYNWLQGLVGLQVVADTATTIYSSVKSLDVAGSAILENGGVGFAYSNMAAYGFYLPAGAAGISLSAIGQTGTQVGGQVALLTSLGGDPGTAAVRTDKADYAPGTVVTITGHGYKPGETVTITLHEDPLFDTHPNLTATADANGNWTNAQFSPDAHDIEIRFIVTALGDQGSKAQTTFTDQTSLKSVSISGAQTPNPVTPGTSATFGTTAATSMHVDFNGAGSCTVTLSASGLPAGATATFAPGPTITGTSTSTVDVLLTINTTSGTPAGTLAFTVTATGTGGAGNNCTSSDTRSSSPTNLVVGGNAATNTSIVSDNDPSTYGHSVAFTTTVNVGATAVTTGSVTFIEGGTCAAPTTTLAGPTALNGSGQAAFSTSTLTVPSHTIVACYGGATGFNASNGSVTQTVNKKTLTASIVGDPTKPYDGNTNATLAPANFSLTGLVGTENFSVSKTTGTYNSKDVATATTVSTTLAAGDFTAVAGTSATNYTLPTTASGPGHITTVTLPAAVIGNPTKPYDGNTNATLTSANFSLTGLVGTESFTVTKTTGTYNSKDVATAATASATLVTSDFTPVGSTLATNYTLPTTASGAGHITTVTLTASIIGDPTKPYDGNTNATLTSANFSLSGLVSGESFTVTQTAGTYNSKDVATANTVTASLTAGDFTPGSGTAAGNYTLPTTASGAGHITARSATWTTNSNSKIYGDPDPNPLTTGSGSFLAADGVTVAYSRAVGETVLGGPYHITATLSPAAVLSNYTITNAGADFAINPRPATWTTNPNSKTYGDADPNPLTTGSGSFLAADGVTVAYSRAVGETVLGGPYHITATLSPAAVLSNYTITNAGADFAINPRPATWTTNPNSKTYGDADPNPLTTGSGSFLAADGVTVAYSRAVGETVLGGPYHITATLSPAAVLSNYTITNAGADFAINPRPATWTTNPNSKTYGDADPNPLTTGSGSFLAADGVTVAYSRAAGETVLGGPYHITATLGPSAVLSNYSITNTGAGFSINARPATWTTNPNSKTYGDADPNPLTNGSGNFLAADGVTAAYSRAAGETVLDGPYHTTATLGPTAVLSNYAITNTGASFGINPKPLTVAVVSQSRNFGNLTPLSFSVSYSAFAFGEGPAVLGGPVVFTPAAATFDNTTPAGITTIAPSGLTSTNYSISFVTGTLTIVDTTAPVVTSFTLSANPIPVGSSTTLSAAITDVGYGSSNIAAAEYSTDGGATWLPMNSYTPSPAVNVSKTISPATGVYNVCVRGKDAANNVSDKVCILLAVYDPSAGFVTGGGWINSPAGAYYANPSLVGRANFGFVSQYKKGANVPTGDTEFQFQVGNLNFKSTSYDWLVVSGGSKAQYKGSGTINGSGDYGFILTAVDGDGKKADTFRIKIWDKATSAIVYDNQLGASDTSDPTTTLAGGNIVVH